MLVLQAAGFDFQECVRVTKELAVQLYRNRRGWGGGVIESVVSWFCVRFRDDVSEGHCWFYLLWNALQLPQILGKPHGPFWVQTCSDCSQSPQATPPKQEASPSPQL